MEEDRRYGMGADKGKNGDERAWPGQFLPKAEQRKGGATGREDVTSKRLTETMARACPVRAEL